MLSVIEILRAWSFTILVAVPAAVAVEEKGVYLRFHATQPAASDAQVKVTVSGQVTDAASGKPIAGATVRGHLVLWRFQGPDMFDHCALAEGRCGEDGTYSLTFNAKLTTSGAMKDKDNVCIDARAPGYETRPVYVKPDVTPERTEFEGVNVALAAGKLVRGKVVDEDDRPVAGARVTIDQGLNGDWKYFASLGETKTGEDGAFEIRCTTDRELFGKEPWLWIEKEDYGTRAFWDVLKKDDMGKLVLRRGGTIQGRVLDARGAGVSGCPVMARDDGQRVSAAARTDAEGKYVLRGVTSEQTWKELAMLKNGRWLPQWGQVTVYARPDANVPMRDTPQYRIHAQDGKTVNGPDLKLGVQSSVVGRLIASKTTTKMAGLLVRLDYDWGHMVEVVADGSFKFDYVQPGKHRLAAYLPNNLRGDRGIGSVEVQVKEGEPLENVAIQLETLAEVRVQILDDKGNPLEGITAGATWTKSGEGFWTEGTVSDKDGRAVLYLYPEKDQYVRGFDFSHKWVAEGFEKVAPKAGQTVENVRITMVPPAKLHGKLMSADGKVMADQRLGCRLVYADQVERREVIRTDASGQFKLTALVPGVVKLSVQRDEKDKPVELIDAPVELKPGEDKDLGVVAVKAPQN